MNAKMPEQSRTSESNSPPRSRISGTVIGGGLLLCVLAFLMTFNLRLLSGQLEESARQSSEHAFWVLCHPGTTAEQRTRFFLKLVADGNTEWRSARLQNLQLEGVDLKDADLQSATFSMCDLGNADLTDSDLTKAALENSDLSGATFVRANMRDASLFKSVLHNAVFREAELLSVSLEQAKAHEVSFVAAKMGDAFLAMADLTGSDFTGANLSGANLEAAVFKNTDLALANLFGTRLVDTDFTDSNWWRARGLSSQQLDEFTIAFPPTADAAESRKRDFEIWLTKRVELKERPRASSD